jgi:TctA family transporter
MTTSIFRWAPRVLAILFAMFLSIFALDVFGEGYGFFDTVLALLIHLIPTFIVVATIILAWKWELVGALVFTALAAAYGIMAWGRTDWWLGIGAPMMLTGILYYISWRSKKAIA